jgi:hypothetical protein
MPSPINCRSNCLRLFSLELQQAQADVQWLQQQITKMESEVAKGMALTTNVHFGNSAATCSLLNRDVHSAADEQLGILNADCMKSEGVHKSKRICRSARPRRTF